MQTTRGEVLTWTIGSIHWARDYEESISTVQSPLNRKIPMGTLLFLMLESARSVCIKQKSSNGHWVELTKVTVVGMVR